MFEEKLKKTCFFPTEGICKHSESEKKNFVHRIEIFSLEFYFVGFKKTNLDTCPWLNIWDSHYTSTVNLILKTFLGILLVAN